VKATRNEAFRERLIAAWSVEKLDHRGLRDTALKDPRCVSDLTTGACRACAMAIW
jgi:hypothetical protein